jgi:tetratricopeptide (TPR) repeat protein
MKKLLIAVVPVLVLGLFAACTQDAKVDVDQEWADFRAAYGEVDATEDKLELIEGFIRKHPGSTYAGMLAGAVAYYRGDEMGDPDGALALLNATLDLNTDPEARFQIAIAMFPLSAELGEPMDLDVVAEELAAVRPLGFVEMIDIADMAVEHEQWQVGAKYAEAALEKATPEAFLADYPDDEFTQDEAAAKAQRRQVMSLADLGWALWNLGRPDEAIAAFERALPLRTEDYIGASDTNLDLFAGKVALANGDPARAMELLATSSIMGSDDESMAAYREAYIADRGTSDGLDERLWSERQRLARKIDDFTLADYEGVDRQFSALSDGKVTLLAFWFPT